MVSENRHSADIGRAYEGDGIVVYWEPALCIHTGNCIRGLPQTFDPDARPWVNAGAASADEIAEVILTCPTGALSFERNDGGPQEGPARPATIQPRKDGPLFLRGEFAIVDTSGDVVRTATRMALCRCGQSRNKPYCDLSHRAAGFQS